MIDIPPGQGDTVRVKIRSHPELAHDLIILRGLRAPPSGYHVRKELLRLLLRRRRRRRLLLLLLLQLRR
jgi:hypothetical protein